MGYKKAQLGLKLTKLEAKGLGTSTDYFSRKRDVAGSARFAGKTDEEIEDSGMTPQELLNEQKESTWEKQRASTREKMNKARSIMTPEEFKKNFGVENNGQEFSDDDVNTAIRKMMNRVERGVDLNNTLYTEEDILKAESLNYYENAESAISRGGDVKIEEGITSLINGTIQGENEALGKIPLYDFTIDGNGNHNFDKKAKPLKLEEFIGKYLKESSRGKNIKEVSVEDLVPEAQKSLKMQVATSMASDALQNKYQTDEYNALWNFRNRMFDSKMSTRDFDERGLSVLGNVFEGAWAGVKAGYYGIASQLSGDEGGVFEQKYRENVDKLSNITTEGTHAKFVEETYNQDVTGLLKELDVAYGATKDENFVADVAWSAARVYPPTAEFANAAEFMLDPVYTKAATSEFFQTEDGRWKDMDWHDLKSQTEGEDAIDYEEIKSGALESYQSEVTSIAKEYIGEGVTDINIPFDNADAPIMVEGLQQVMEDQLGDNMIHVDDETTMNMTYTNKGGVEQIQVSGLVKGTEAKSQGEITFEPNAGGKSVRMRTVTVTGEQFNRSLTPEALAEFNRIYDRTPADPALLPSTNPTPNISQVIPSHDVEDSKIIDQVNEIQNLYKSLKLPKEELASVESDIWAFLSYGGFEVRPLAEEGTNYRTTIGIRDSDHNFKPRIQIGTGVDKLSPEYVRHLKGDAALLKEEYLLELVAQDVQRRRDGLSDSSSKLKQIIAIISNQNQ